MNVIGKRHASAATAAIAKVAGNPDRLDFEIE